MTTYKITASGRNFSQAIAFLKKIGGKFDGYTKLWSVEKILDLDTCRLWGLLPVQHSTYRDWSDNPNSSL